MWATITFACHGDATMKHHPPLDRLHQHTQTKRTAKRTAHAPTLSEPSTGATADRDLYYPKGHFGPQHGLTPAQAWEAQQLLNRANRLRPLRGPDAQARFALRMGGIIAAVKGGRVGNSAFGRKLHGHRGGKVMARHALHHLRAIAPLGSQAAAAKRRQKKVPQATQDALARWGERAETMPWTEETGVYWPEE
jgi:hypothetical protein